MVFHLPLDIIVIWHIPFCLIQAEYMINYNLLTKMLMNKLNITNYAE